MVIFNLTPFSGHITKAIEASVEIAEAFPQHTFFLTFNSRRLKVTTSEQMHKEYFRE